MLGQEVKTKFVELRAEGISLRKISGQIGVSKTTLVDWNRKFAADISRMKAAEMESMLDAYHVSLDHRVERLAQRLKQVENELAKRDLGDVPTVHLLREYRYILEALREELVNLERGEAQHDPYLKILAGCSRVIDDATGIAVTVGQTISQLSES